MATVTELHLSLQTLSFKDTYRNDQNLRSSFKQFTLRNSVFAHKHSINLGRVSIRPCRSFRSEDRNDNTEEEKHEEIVTSMKSKKGAMNSLRSFMLDLYGAPSRQEEYRNTVAKAEEFFFSCATQVGRYLVTMMSTGVILATGFQLSGGDSQLNTLIWYSWLGGIIIGTMIGSNMVLEEHYRAGPRNIVITGGY